MLIRKLNIKLLLFYVNKFIKRYWTGYYTSRTNFKFMVKTFGRYLQSIRTMFGILSLDNNTYVTS